MVSRMIFHSGPTQIPREWRYPIYHHCSLNMIPNVRYSLRRRVPSVYLSKRQLSVAVFSSSHLPSFGSDQRLNGVESEPTLLHPTRAFTKTVLLQNRHSFHVTPILCAGNDRYVPDRTIDSSCVGVTKQAYLVKQRLGFYQVDFSHKPVALVFYNKASFHCSSHTVRGRRVSPIRQQRLSASAPSPNPSLPIRQSSRDRTASPPGFIRITRLTSRDRRSMDRSDRTS